MGEVVGLPPPKTAADRQAEAEHGPGTRARDIAWRCNCGCLSWVIHGDDTISCAKCQDTSDEPPAQGEWRKYLPVVPEDLDRVTDVDRMDSTICVHATAEEARTRVRNLIDGTTELIIVVGKDGGHHTWSGDIETKAQYDWHKRKLAEADQILFRKCPPRDELPD